MYLHFLLCREGIYLQMLSILIVLIINLLCLSQVDATVCYVEKEISKLLDINMELSCGVILGKPNQQPKMRPRKELKDIVMWID